MNIIIIWLLISSFFLGLHVVFRPLTVGGDGGTLKYGPITPPFMSVHIKLPLSHETFTEAFLDSDYVAEAEHEWQMLPLISKKSNRCKRIFFRQDGRGVG